jgi:hypothetical protein
VCVCVCVCERERERDRERETERKRETWSGVERQRAVEVLRSVHTCVRL